MSKTGNRSGLFKASSSIQIFALMFTVSVLSGCNITPSATPAPQASTLIEALAEPFELISNPVADGQSRIIFYRPAETTVSGVSSIHINGRYHTSLVPGGYSPICVKSGTVELGVRHIDVKTRPNKDGFDNITELQTISGQNQYVRVHNLNGMAVALVPVAAQQALSELATTRLQVHTISRAETTDCVTTLAPQPIIPVGSSAQNLQLSGDAFFSHNRTDRANLSQQGLHVIDESLSLSRDGTTRNHLALRTNNTVRPTSQVRSERELVINECGDQQTPTSIACNRLNRPVVS